MRGKIKKLRGKTEKLREILHLKIFIMKFDKLLKLEK